MRARKRLHHLTPGIREQMLRSSMFSMLLLCPVWSEYGKLGVENWLLDRVWLVMYLNMDFQYGNRNSFSLSCWVTVQTLRSDSPLADLCFMLAVKSLQRNLVLSHIRLWICLKTRTSLFKVIQILPS